MVAGQTLLGLFVAAALACTSASVLSKTKGTEKGGFYGSRFGSLYGPSDFEDKPEPIVQVPSGVPAPHQQNIDGEIKIEIPNIEDSPKISDDLRTGVKGLRPFKVINLDEALPTPLEQESDDYRSGVKGRTLEEPLESDDYRTGIKGGVKGGRKGKIEVPENSINNDEVLATVQPQESDDYRSVKGGVKGRIATPVVSVTAVPEPEDYRSVKGGVKGRIASPVVPVTAVPEDYRSVKGGVKGKIAAPVADEEIASFTPQVFFATTIQPQADDYRKGVKGGIKGKIEDAPLRGDTIAATTTLPDLEELRSNSAKKGPHRGGYDSNPNIRGLFTDNTEAPLVATTIESFQPQILNLPLEKRVEEVVSPTEDYRQQTESPVQRIEPAIYQTELPVQQTESPVQRVQPPVYQTELPVQQTESPVQRIEPAIYQTELPVQQTESPVQRIQPPIYQTELPVQQTESPVQKIQPPVYQTEIPVQQTESPVQKIQPPVYQTEEPYQQTEEPYQQTELPVQQTQRPVKEWEPTTRKVYATTYPPIYQTTVQPDVQDTQSPLDVQVTQGHHVYQTTTDYFNEQQTENPQSHQHPEEAVYVTQVPVTTQAPDDFIKYNLGQEGRHRIHGGSQGKGGKGSKKSWRPSAPRTVVAEGPQIINLGTIGLNSRRNVDPATPLLPSLQ